MQAFKHLDKADTFPVDLTVADTTVDEYGGLVLPGGVANPDALRMDERAVAFVREFFQAGKPVAAICHAPWTLVEADVVRGRTLTSWPSLRTDIRNAGGEWVDEHGSATGHLCRTGYGGVGRDTAGGPPPFTPPPPARGHPPASCPATPDAADDGADIHPPTGPSGCCGH